MPETSQKDAWAESAPSAPKEEKMEEGFYAFDWSELVKHYDQAHEMALARLEQRVGRIEIRVV